MRFQKPVLGDWRQVHYDNGNQVVAFKGPEVLSSQHVDNSNSWRENSNRTASYGDREKLTFTFGNQRNITANFCRKEKITTSLGVDGNHTSSIGKVKNNKTVTYENCTPEILKSGNRNHTSFDDNSVLEADDRTAYSNNKRTNTEYINSNANNVTKSYPDWINFTRASPLTREDYDNTSSSYDYNNTGDLESTDYQSTQNYYPIGLTQDFYTKKSYSVESGVDENAVSGNKVINGDVYNQQYRNHNNIEDDCRTREFIGSSSNTSLFDCLTLEGQQLVVCGELSPVDNSRENGDQRHMYSSVESTPLDDEDRAFEPSDTDEQSDYDGSRHPLPRGIVNPNYPGFQHFAHALQDYSTNLDNLYSYETDEDVDIHSDQNLDIRNIGTDCYENVDDCNGNLDDNTEGTYLSEHFETRLHENAVIYGTGNIFKEVELDNQHNSNASLIQIPDLLKDTKEDIECRVHSDNESSRVIYDAENLGSNLTNATSASTLDIVGDFGKEIEHEIGLIVNRNLTFQQDLDALQRDINEAIRKPIEETINNISEVVNIIIEKLVEQDGGESIEWLAPFKNKELDLYEPIMRSAEENKLVFKETDQFSKEEDISESNNIETSVSKIHNNPRGDSELCRPSFLYLGNDPCKTKDTYLSEVKREKNIEKDSATISNHIHEKCPTKVEIVKEGSSNLNPKVDESNFKKPVTKETPMSSDLLMSKTICKEALFDNATEKEKDTTLPKNQESTYQMNSGVKRRERSGACGGSGGGGGTRQRGASSYNRRSVPQVSRKHKSSSGGFDVYNIESAMPEIDLEAIENHLRAAKEEERLRRNDREEIRRRLAMGTELDELRSFPHTGHDRPARKPSLQSRLQSGMNLQICFMNETASDNESPNSDSESNTGQQCNKPFSAAAYSLNNHPYQTKPLSVSNKHIEAPNLKVGGRVRPSSLALRSPAVTSCTAQSQSLGSIALTEADFFARQARLQTEARMALAQAKEIARMQMEKERRERATSPVTEMVRRGLSLANVGAGEQRRRVSRHMLTHMNIAQLQVIVNELHSQIESLNEGLVTLLMTRDELHMGQDSMLVDIEDLTRFLGAKEQCVGVVPPLSPPFLPSSPPRVPPAPPRSLLAAPAALLKPRLHRIAALVRK